MNCIMRKLIFFFLLLWKCSFSDGQSSGFLKYNYGVSWYQVLMNSNSGLFSLDTKHPAIFSFLYEQDINEGLSIETGITDRHFEAGMTGKLPNTFYVGARADYFTIPLRLILHEKIIGNISMFSRVGTSFSVAYKTHKPEEGNTSDNYSVKIDTNLPGNYFSFDFGAGLEWIFSKNKLWKFFAVYDYHLSSKNLIDITTSNNATLNYANLKSSGNYHTLTFGGRLCLRRIYRNRLYLHS